ncbi:MAG: transcriptional regulator, TetR family [Verrucomicrobiaceae bacterium]|nr:transcriptional regulator, TetR family [Verrucomicrobiaceae bacterium]
MTSKKLVKPKSPSRNPEGRPKSAEKRVAIMDAAELHFLESGYERTSLDTVAKTALVSKLTIYSHFADKDALFKAIIERKCEQHSIFQSYLELAALPPREALEQIGFNFMSLILSDAAIKLHRTIEAESPRDPKSALLFYEAGPMRVKRAFRELLEVWVKQKKLKVSDYEIACEQFFSVMKGEPHMKVLLNVAQKPTLAALKKHVKAGVLLFLNSYGCA